MRILHTSDWHLGKHLEGHSRLDEQTQFTEELIDIVDNNDIDMILIAGDIYDTSNPPAKAERLFYKTVKRLSNDGNRVVLVIAGNHDNPDRLSAASPLAYEHGVILLGTPKSIAQCGKYSGFEIVDSGEGYVEIIKNDESSVIITLPYPSEKRLNELFTDSLNEDERQSSYSERVGELFKEVSSKFRDDTINLAVSHLFVMGGDESDSERTISVGGSMTVNLSHMPEKSQYTALGHLHKPQKFKKKNVYYSGSPIQYSKSEINYSKCVYIVDVKPKEEALIKEVYLSNYKPIEIFKTSSIEEAISICEENKDKNMWAYLEIETDRVLTQSEIKKMKELLPDIIEIKPVIKGIDTIIDEKKIEISEMSFSELYKDYFKSINNVEPTKELLEVLLEITNENEEDDAVEEVKLSEAY